MKSISFLACLALATGASASILSIQSGDTLVGNHGSNLITNGSFEADDPAQANLSYWATGTANTPYFNLTGWQSSGGSSNYALWGHDTGPGLEGSAPLADGNDGLYFGAGIMAITSGVPVFHPDGTITFGSTPVFQPKPTFGPVSLFQTLNGLNTSQTYLLDFWVSGEDASFTTSQFSGDGIFEFNMTGESSMYFAAPSGSSGLGTSQRYQVYFKPSASSVTFDWVNYGHWASPTGLRTEIVLDDVIVNTYNGTVPEPTSMAALALGVGAICRRRRQA
ncbi:MAG: PEP-CTERM sorting domain-containing protein [Armatimonadetes bacterium]|nr:PEP-CTERM sorting domain-containing protein [Armatimonadota bacterium]